MIGAVCVKYRSNFAGAIAASLLALPDIQPEKCNKIGDKTCPAGRFCVFLALHHSGLQAPV